MKKLVIPHDFEVVVIPAVLNRNPEDSTGFRPPTKTLGGMLTARRNDTSLDILLQIRERLQKLFILAIILFAGCGSYSSPSDILVNGRQITPAGATSGSIGNMPLNITLSPDGKYIEDDAQFSNDHIDSHRSFAQVISPWIKTATVDSHFYDTNSVLKSIELLFGLSPMSQYDHFANPIMGGWDTSPNNNAAYAAILPPSEIIGDVNPSIASYGVNDPRRHLAVLSGKMNWSVADAVPYNVLNEILWKDAKGVNSKMPEFKVSRLDLPGDLQAMRSDGNDD